MEEGLGASGAAGDNNNSQPVLVSVGPGAAGDNDGVTAGGDSINTIHHGLVRVGPGPGPAGSPGPLHFKAFREYSAVRAGEAPEMRYYLEISADAVGGEEDSEEEEKEEEVPEESEGRIVLGGPGQKGMFDLDVVVLADVSGSMRTKVDRRGRTRLQLLKEALVEIVSSIGPRDRVAVIPYNNDLHPVTTRGMLESVGDHNRDRIMRAIRGLGAGGRTDIEKALKEAMGILQLRPSTEATTRQSLVLLMTDGAPTQGALSFAELDPLAKRPLKTHSVKVVLFGDEADRSLVTEVARESEGEMVSGSDPEAFARNMTQAAESERSAVARQIRVEILDADAQFRRMDTFFKSDNSGRNEAYIRNIRDGERRGIPFSVDMHAKDGGAGTTFTPFTIKIAYDCVDAATKENKRVEEHFAAVPVDVGDACEIEEVQSITVMAAFARTVALNALVGACDELGGVTYDTSRQEARRARVHVRKARFALKSYPPEVMEEPRLAECVRHLERLDEQLQSKDAVSYAQVLREQLMGLTHQHGTLSATEDRAANAQDRARGDFAQFFG